MFPAPDLGFAAVGATGGVIMNPANPGVADGTAPDRRPTMQPVVIGSSFGWLHYIRATKSSDVAVLICSGLNWDMVRAHHPLRNLADELAIAGYPAMRFDYPDTGDSAEDPERTELWETWRKSIHAALDHLRRETGARRVILCGVRIGATLATLAAEQRDDVAALVLLAPVLRGRSYVQQLQMQARLENRAAVLPDGGLELHELYLGAETLERIAQVDLRNASLPPDLPVGLFMQAPSKLGADCERAWRQKGADVTSTDFACLAPMLQPIEGLDTRPMDFSPLLAWMRQVVPTPPVSVVGAAGPAAVLAAPGWVETPLRFGPDDALFGMFCRPDGDAGDLAVIIGNTGLNPHYGVARFAVQFARDLARSGIASFRIDFAGLGDSADRTDKIPVSAPEFNIDRSADIGAAIDLLSQLGYRRFAVHGICSGAYHALHGAVADQRIGVVLMVNLPVLEWRSDDDLFSVTRRNTKLSHYVQRLVAKEAWGRLMRDLDIGKILWTQAERTAERARDAVLGWAERRGWVERQSVGRRIMTALSRRQVKTFFLFSSGDHGVDAIEQEFGRGGTGLMAFAGTTVRIVPGLDHMLTAGAMRRTAIDLMIRYVTELNDGGDAGSLPNQAAAVNPG
ncbi:MAG TPA: alpha/beta hydrolase [Rhodopila sp.]|uniref:serine aminopeptidase domain-containing protein n=1 Tax=Rhodopila sp. TaxID=2480087 RepID=UPI002CECF145|nr:alpha/beta hydrolase [Rhodopila sp.]HVY14539.1 alpha/beta hydrolase [Rhodopila sp.]